MCEDSIASGRLSAMLRNSVEVTFAPTTKAHGLLSVGFSGREPVPRELSVNVDFHSIDLHKPSFAEVDHHVPVQSRLVVVPSFRISRAHGEVHRAANLFIEER